MDSEPERIIRAMGEVELLPEASFSAIDIVRYAEKKTELLIGGFLRPMAVSRPRICLPVRPYPSAESQRPYKLIFISKYRDNSILRDEVLRA